jgi:hypothetical protein
MPARFSEKLLSLFPEVQARASPGDTALPYVLMAYLVAFLEQQAEKKMQGDVVNRLVEFNFWCRKQTWSKDKEDDISTLLVVGLYEKILQKNDLYPLIVKLVSKKELVDAKEYLRRWVNEAQFARALALYPSS